MGLLGSKDKANSGAAAEPDRATRHRHVELLGREFRVIEEGLDPNEVLDFIETIAGSSEATFERLEQFSAFRALTRTMGNSIEAARKLAEHAKVQAIAEVQLEKDKATEEVRRQVAAMLDHASKSCIVAIDDAYSVVLEGIKKAAEIERAAFEKARQAVSSNLAAVHQEIRNMVEAQQRQSDRDAEQSGEKAPGQSPDSVDVASASEAPETEPEEEPIPGLASLESEEAPDGVETAQRPALEAADSEEPVEVAAVAAEPTEDSERLYSGDLALVIPEGTGESWMAELRERLLSIPGLAIRQESGDARAVVVNLLLDKPARLLPILRGMPKVTKVAETRNGVRSSEGMRLRWWQRTSANSPETTLAVELDKGGFDEPSRGLGSRLSPGS